MNTNKRTNKISLVVVALIFLLTGCSHKNIKPADTILQAQAQMATEITENYDDAFFGAIADSVTVAEKIQANLDNRNAELAQWSELAKYLVGMRLDSTNRYAPLTRTSNWVSYQQRMWTMWDRYRKNAQKAAAWRDSCLKPYTKGCKQLLYAFSGPDWPYANTFFPDVDEYIMLAAEPIGSIPSPSMDMTDKEIADLANELYYPMVNIWGNSFFVTGRMEKNLRKKTVDGVLPVLMMFMGRDYRNIDNITIGLLCADGRIDTTSNKKPNSLRMQVSKNGKRQTITYISCNLENKGMAADSVLNQFLASYVKDGCCSFLKAASYLPHYNSYSNIRNIILQKSKFILQDDSGIRYEHLLMADYSCHLWGKYVKPISAFKNCLQEELADAYKDQNPQPLNFQFGYGQRFCLIGAEK